MAEIPMTAKFPGTCIICIEPIKKGDAIWYLPDTKKAKHRACGEQAPKPAKKVAKKATLRSVKDKVAPETKVVEGKAPEKPHFRRFTVMEILKLLPALRAFNDAVTEAGFKLQDMDEAKLAEIFRIAKNATFSENKDDYPF